MRGSSPEAPSCPSALVLTLALAAAAAATLAAPLAAQWPQAVAGDQIAIETTADPQTAVDGDGNVFLAGTFKGDATFGDSATYSSVAGSWDVYLAKYGPLGDLEWVLTAGGPGKETVAALALDPGGAAYLTGTFDDVATFGAAGDLDAPKKPNPFDTADVFFAQAADSPVPGEPPAWQWVKAFRTRYAEGDDMTWTGDDRVIGLAVDDEAVYGAVTAAGAFTAFQLIPLPFPPSPSLATHPDGSAALIRLASSDGAREDIRVVDGGGSEFGFGLCRVTGLPTVVCPNLPAETSSSALALGSASLYLGLRTPGAKLDSYVADDLSFRWRTSDPNDEISDLAIDAGGDVYTVESGKQVAKYVDNTTSASQSWSHDIDSTNRKARSLTFADAGSRLFVGGNAKDGSTSNKKGVVWEVENLDADPAADPTDVPTSFEFATIRTDPGCGDCNRRVRSLASDGDRQLAVAGTFTGLALFGDPTDPQTESLFSQGDTRDAFATRLDTAGNWARFEDHAVGAKLTPPAGADTTVGPAIEVDGVAQPAIYTCTDGVDSVPVGGQAFFCLDDTVGKLWAIRPVTAKLTWDDGAGGPLLQFVVADWPDEADRQLHPHGATVDLTTGTWTFEEIAYSEDDTTNVDIDGVFQRETSGFSTLRFTDAGSVAFVVVDSRPPLDFDESFCPVPGGCTVAVMIGQALDVPGGHADATGTGFVAETNAPIDATGADAAYDRAIRSGQIIPVNTGDFSVFWYQDGDGGIAWPAATRIPYRSLWPISVSRIMIKNQVGSEDVGQPVLDPAVFPDLRIYIQNDPALPGFNPNDEHALLAPSNTGSGFSAAFALRQQTDVSASEPYVLLKHGDGGDGWAFRVYRVEASGSGDFAFDVEAGVPVPAPYPLALVGGCADPDFDFGDGTGGCNERACNVEGEPFFEDYQGNVYAQADGQMLVNYLYPIGGSFYDDPLGQGMHSAATGDCVRFVDQAVRYDVTWPPGIPTLQVGRTHVSTVPDLPDLQTQAAVEIVFEGGESTFATGGAPSAPSDPTALVKLYDPVSPRWVEVPTQFPVALIEAAPWSLEVRLEHDAVSVPNRLAWKGLYREQLGEPLLLPNVLTAAERASLQALDSDTGSDWDIAIDALYVLSRDPRGVGAADGDLTIGLDADADGANERARLLGQPGALSAGAASATGYVTLAFNNDPSLEPSGLPVSLAVIRVGCEAHGAAAGRPYQGVAHSLPTDDLFSERLTLRHSGDFGGDPAGIQFDWYLQLDTDGEPDDLPSDEVNAWIEDTTASGDGAHELIIEGANVRTISDNWVFARYGGTSGLGACGAATPFAGSPSGEPDDPDPQLAEGWIKRVIRGLSPFRARSADFHAAPANTVVSMIRQAGPPYSGPIAFNGDPANVNSIGLIEAYETVLRRGQTLSIDAGFDNAAANTALLLAAGRVADLYMLLANEGWADAQDPTIGFGTQSGTYGTLAPTIFAFQNQLPSLLGEELALLRGRDDSGTAINVPPVFNRLIWNIETGDLGEVAYSQVYNLQDTDGNGFIDTADAITQFPQGHGDAWGQYLSALESYTRLLRHPRYTWVPRAENVLIAGLPVLVDYRDERKLAATAAARAKAGAEIVDLTYRGAYTEDPDGQWRGYPDADSTRAWGVAEWGHRAGQGAYLDWVTAHAVLPAVWTEPEPGERDCVLDGTDSDAAFAADCIAGGLTFLEVGQIDRSNVPELAEIVCHYEEIQAQLDEGDAGLNPLGLARGVVPFDIDPSLVDAGETHFEQIHGRAAQALDSAVAVFDHANQLSETLRRNQDSLQDFSNNVDDRERDLRNRLIEIFGYPYADDIGGAGTYPPGYDDADLYHYQYVDPTELTGEPPGPTETITAFFAPIPNIGRFIGDPDPNPAPDFEVEYVFDPNGIGVVRPASWSGSRQAPGEVQRALSEYYRSVNAYQRAIAAYDILLAGIEGAAAVLEAQYDLHAAEIDLLSPGGDKKLNEKILGARIEQLSFLRSAEGVRSLAASAAESLPKSAGLATDVTSTARGAILAIGANLAGTFFDALADAAEAEQFGHELAKEEAAAQDELELETARNEFEVVQRVAALEQLIRQEPVLRLEIFDRREIVRQAIGGYQTVLARGLRLVDELASFRARTAGEVQQYRYQDMAFRVARNDALQKYKAQFDLAARYSYLAATAYDYETNLLGSASDAGRDFLTDIVKQRSLGEILGGQPQVGARGLSDPLARMGFNFQVLKGQLGFNNPQTETTRFALRSELQRISEPSVEICHADGSFDVWGTQMMAWRVENLWDLPEFRRYARPFAAEPSAECAPADGLVAGCEPALVIPFSTTVTAGLNFFGFPLGPGDSAYDASNFATRVRSVGTWLTGYENAGLSATPSVYLLPVGNDVLRPPAAGNFTTREWAVVDQVLPVPFPIGASDLLDPAYIPVNDGLSSALGQLGDVRRISSFRAYPDSGTFDPSQTTTNSRLIGRSVWNTQWLLIIPGRTLLADPFLGLDQLVCNVSDIKLFFQTYAYSGN